MIVSDDGEEAELVGLRHGEAIEEDAFGEGEDDGVGSDAEGERGDGDGGEAGAAAEHADGVAEVWPEASAVDHHVAERMSLCRSRCCPSRRGRHMGFLRGEAAAIRSWAGDWWKARSSSSMSWLRCCFWRGARNADEDVRRDMADS